MGFMKRPKHLLILLTILPFLQCSPDQKTSQPGKDLYSLKADFAEQRFGMFICYNIMSYGAKWGQANYPIDTFNP
jgi:alpha-L-fucosidase